MSAEAEQAIYCWSCGTKLPATFSFCSKCGSRLSVPSDTESAPTLPAPAPVEEPTLRSLGEASSPAIPVDASPAMTPVFAAPVPATPVPAAPVSAAPVVREPTLELTAVDFTATQLQEEGVRPTLASVLNERRHLPGLFIPPDPASPEAAAPGAISTETPPPAQPLIDEWVEVEKKDIPGILVNGARIAGLMLFFWGVGIVLMIALMQPTFRAHEVFYVPLLIIGGAAIAIQPRILTDLLAFVKFKTEMSYQVAGVLVAIGAIISANVLQATLFKTWERSAMIRAAAAASAAEEKAAALLPPPVLTAAEESAMVSYLGELAKRDEVRHRVMAPVRRASGATGTATGTPSSGSTTAPAGQAADKVILLQMVWIRSSPAPAHLKTFVTIYTELLANELAVSQSTRGMQKESEQQNSTYQELCKALAKESERLQKLYPSFPARKWGT